MNESPSLTTTLPSDSIQNQQIDQLNLLDLPHELLLDIFKDYVKAESPICKSLLPFTRAPIFKYIRIKSIEQFNSFTQTILKDNSVGHLVIELDVTIEVDDCTVVVVTDHILVVLKHLINVKVLKINWEWLSTIVCSRLVASSSLPQLKYLKLINPFESQLDPWGKYHFRHLVEYQEPLHLSFKTNNSRSLVDEKFGELVLYDTFINEDELERRANERSILRSLEDGLQNLFTLEELKGNLVKTQPRKRIFYFTLNTTSIDRSLIDTILSFRIVTLRVSDSLIETPGFTILLKELNPDLYQLHFYEDTSKSLSSNSSFHIYPIITRFTNLRRLTITANVFTSQLFDYVRDPLPLKSIKFTRSTAVKISDLEQLFLPGPAKLSALKTLVLNNVNGAISGIKVEEEGPYYDEEIDEFTVHPGWILPEWSTDFSELGLIQLRKGCKEQQVSIKGTSIRAIGIRKNWEKEVDLAEEMAQEILEY